jgi:hypothetical protein
MHAAYDCQAYQHSRCVAVSTKSDKPTMHRKTDVNSPS